MADNCGKCAFMFKKRIQMYICISVKNQEIENGMKEVMPSYEACEFFKDRDYANRVQMYKSERL